MKQTVTFILFLLAFVATASGSVVVETRPNASATFIRSIPVQDTTGNIGASYGLRFNATMDTLVWFDISTSGSIDSIFVQYGTSAWSASGWYKNGDTLTIDTSDAGASGGDNILIDSGSAVVDPSTIILQEGADISFVLGNDTLVISATVDSVTKALQDASGNVITTTYLTSATAASTYETITNVGLIGDDTTTWNAVAAAFDTTYDQLTVGGQVLSGDASILAEAELTDSLNARGFLTSLALLWDTLSNKDTVYLYGSADTIVKFIRDPAGDTTWMTVPTGILVIQGGSNGIPTVDSLLLTNSGYVRLADLVLDSALFDSIVNASGRFAIGAGTGADSVKIDSGGAVTDMSGVVVFQEGANVDITVNGDTVIIAYTGGASGADSILVDTAGTGINMGDAGGGFVIREGNNVTLTMVGDTLTITANASGSSVWDVNGDTTQYTDADNDTNLKIYDGDNDITTISSGSNDTLVITAPDLVQIGSNAGRVWVDSLDIDFYLSIGTGNNQMDSALFDSIVNGLGRFSVAGGVADDIKADTGSAVVDMTTAVLQAGPNITLDVVNGDTLVITSTGGGATIEVDSAGNATNIASLTNLILQEGSNTTLTVDGDTVTIASTGGGIFDVSNDTAQYVDADSDTILRMYDRDDDTTRLDAGNNALIVGAEGTTYSDSLLLFGWLNIGSAGTMDSALFDSILNATGRFSVSGGSGDDVKADTGDAVVDLTALILQEGANVTLTLDGDTLAISVDLSSYLTSATAASTYETITNVSLIGDDTATWNAVAAAFDTNYSSITVAGQVLNSDDSIVNIPELMTVLADYLLEADFADTLANYLKVDSGATVVGFGNFVLQEGSNITLTIDGDTVVVAADLSSYLTSATAASTYETIANVALIGDDTATWNEQTDVRVDTGAAIANNSSLVLREGTNINYTMVGDTLTISGATTDGTADSIGVDTNGDGVVDNYLYATGGPMSVIREGTGMQLTVDTDTLYLATTLGASVEGSEIGTDEIDDTHIDWGSNAGQVNTDDVPEGATNFYDKDLPDSSTWSAKTNVLVDTGTANADNANLVLREGSNVTYTMAGDTLTIAVDLSSYLTSATAASTYETIANVALIGDDTANFKTAFGWGDHAAAGYLTAQLWDTINAATLVYVDADTALKITNGTENVTITAGNNDTLTLGSDGITLTDSLFVFEYLNIGNAPILDSALIDSVVNQTGRFASGLSATAFGDTLANHLKVDSGAAVVDMSGLILQEGSNVALVMDGDTVAITVDLSSYLTSATAASIYATITNVDLIGDDTTTWNAVAATFDTNYTQLTVADLQMSGEIDMNSQKITELANPTVGSDAANKDYVDSIANQTQWNNPSIVGNLNLLGGYVNVQGKRNELDITYAYADHADSGLFIPYYRDTDGDWILTTYRFSTVIHPSILYFPQGYNGWKYVLGYTPFGSANDENPAIAVSNDLRNGFTHYVPPGETDTVGIIVRRVDAGVNPGHNADADLTITREGYLMMTWLGVESSDGTDSSWIFASFSRNGASWSSYSAVDTATGVDTTFDTLLAIHNETGNPSGVGVSQSVLIDTGGTYSMWITMADSTNVESYFVKYQSDSAHNGWAVADTCVYTTTSDSLKPWHGSVFGLGNDLLGLLMSECYDSAAGIDANLTLSVSYDAGVTWEYTTKILDRRIVEPHVGVDSTTTWDAISIYRSDAFLIDDYNGFRLGCFYSGKDDSIGNEWGIGYTEIIFNPPIEKEALIYAPDGINDDVPLVSIDSATYPYGIEIVDMLLQLPADAAYSLPVAIYSGDPPSVQDTVAMLTTGASDNYDRVLRADMDNSLVGTGEYIYIELPATDVDWIKVKIRFQPRTEKVGPQ